LIQLVDMRQADIIAIACLERASSQYPWLVSHYRETLGAEHNHAFIAQSQTGEWLGHGVLSIAADVAQLLNFVIHRRWQGQGYAKQVLAAIIEQAVTRGALCVQLELRASNKIAMRQYLQAGFVVDGKRHAYYPTGTQLREDALLMSCHINNI